MRSALALTIACVCAFCGGELVVDQPPGTVADDGGYVLPDGAPVFEAGSGCGEYQPASLPSCNDEVGCTYGFACEPRRGDQCAQQAAAVVPHAYPLFAACTNPILDNVLGCSFNNDITILRCSDAWSYVAQSPVVACHTGNGGDAFCSAYMSQFVLGGGSVKAQCVPSCKPTDTYDGMCWPTADCPSTPDGGTCGSLQMCVTRNGQQACESPCAAP